MDTLGEETCSTADVGRSSLGRLYDKDGSGKTVAEETDAPENQWKKEAHIIA